MAEAADPGEASPRAASGGSPECAHCAEASEPPQWHWQRARALAALHGLLDAIGRRGADGLPAAALAAWWTAAEAARRSRREALFDAMAEQLQAAKSGRRAAERLCQRLLEAHSGCGVESPALAVLGAWRAAAHRPRERRARALAVGEGLGLQCAARDLQLAALALLAWQREARETTQRSVHGDRPAATPVLRRSATLPVGLGGVEGLVGESPSACHGPCTAPQRIQPAPPHEQQPTPQERRQRSASVQPRLVAPQGGSGAASVPTPPTQLVRRQPLVERRESLAGNANLAALCAGAEPKRQLKGPERFYYDTTSYTGCARYGGPMVVDKENRAAADLRPPDQKARRCGVAAQGAGRLCSPRAAASANTGFQPLLVPAATAAGPAAAAAGAARGKVLLLR